MNTKRKPNGYWTKERCHEEALKYTTMKDFRKNSKKAYWASLNMKITDDICSHMIIFGNVIKRCIYSYEFSDNSVYVGLTYNIKNRHDRHTKDINSMVYKKINQKFTYDLKQLTNYIEIEQSKYFEKYYVDEYRKSGWIILNIAKTGSLGGNILKWTKERCQEEALKYKHRNEFQKNSGSAYNSSRSNSWLNEICKHMIETKKPNGYWTKEKCHEEALKYETIKDFQKNSIKACKYAWIMNIMTEICSHMLKYRKKKGHWTKEKCHEE